MGRKPVFAVSEAGCDQVARWARDRSQRETSDFTAEFASAHTRCSTGLIMRANLS